MAKNLSILYPGKIDIDGNNPNGTHKNRTSDVLKNGTPYEKGWASDVWGFLSHILKKAVVSPNGSEENETNSQYYAALEGLVGRRDVKFESKDLIINVQSTTTVDADAERVSLLDSNFIPKFLNDLDLTFTMPTNLEAGTSEKASHWYGMWIDSDLNKRLVPDLAGSADSTVAGFLADSTATLLTDLVHAGDIVHNLTDLTQTTVSADAVVEGQVALTDDIFISGEDYKIVKMSPDGLGENKERIGSTYNNSGSDLDNSIYTQVQEKKTYLGDGTDFTITGTPVVSTLYRAIAIPYQTSDGAWRLNFNVAYSAASAVRTSAQIIFSGVTFKNITNFPQACSSRNDAFSLPNTSVRAIENTGTVAASHTSGTTAAYSFSGDVELDLKPTWAL